MLKFDWLWMLKFDLLYQVSLMTMLKGFLQIRFDYVGFKRNPIHVKFLVELDQTLTC